QSKAKLAEQFYRQQEDQLAHTAHFLAGMTLVSTGVSSNDGSSIAAESSRLRKSTQLNEDDSILIYDNQGKLLYSDLKPAPKRPSAAVLAVLKGSELLGSDLDVIAGQPSLIGVAAIQVGGEREGVVAVVRPFDRRLLNAIEAQTGSPCFIFDASGHLL
ncbi:MAG: hypothetical protein M1118_03875, partial [Chloroflexi bacterium]|nr:hypothetical protein [Chloroflexota bacterium]